MFGTGPKLLLAVKMLKMQDQVLEHGGFWLCATGLFVQENQSTHFKGPIFGLVGVLLGEHREAIPDIYSILTLQPLQNLLPVVSKLVMDFKFQYFHHMTFKPIGMALELSGDCSVLCEHLCSGDAINFFRNVRIYITCMI